MDKSLLSSVAEEFKKAQRILVISHVRPDGDAIGSILGLGLSLQIAGKAIQMVSADGIPTSFRHLPGSSQVAKQPDGHFDLIVFVDCADIDRVGDVLKDYPPPDINIDHHPTNTHYARFNIVDPNAVATAEILAEKMSFFDLWINQEVATALLTGIVTDTLGFRTDNTSPKALRFAADLMEKGADLPSLYYRSLIQRPFEAVRYWGAGLSQLKREDRIVWTNLSLADRESAGYSGRDDADLVNVLTTINDVDLVVIFIEQTNGRVKVSWRARPGYDVAKIAQVFGGGGHTLAAGAEVDGKLEDVQERVLKSTRKLIENR
jgi:bifunctional oligoribonuclease and PAP phosphatase NrnA